MFRRYLRLLRRPLGRMSWLFTRPVILLWAAVLGVVGALTTIAFHEVVKLLQRVHSNKDGDAVDIVLTWSTFEKLYIPTIGGLVAGFCLYLAARIKVDANSDYMEAVAIGNGRLSLRQGFLRVISSLSVTASGWSLGREGPIIHLAAMMGSSLGRLFRLEATHMRLLVACGAAAGVSAAYFAPIAGALLVAEIVLGSMATHILVPLLISSTIAFITIQSLGYQSWLYEIPAVEIVGEFYLFIAVLIGLLSGVLAPMFLRYLDICRRLFIQTKLPIVFSLGLGGFLLGCVFIIEPWVAGKGDTLIHAYLSQTWTWWGVVTILLLKILSTGLSVGSGAVGGVITPVMLVGASVTLLVVQTLALFFPDVMQYLPIFILVGMGAFLGAATSAPLLAIVLIIEISHSFNVIAPLILATVLAYFVARAITGTVMFAVTEQHEQADAVRYELSKLKISSLLHPATTILKMNNTLQDVVNMFTEHSVRYVYFVNDENELLGVIGHQDITRMLLTHRDLNVTIPADLLERTYLEPLTLDMNLDQVQDRFVQFNGERLPVVDLSQPARLVGVVYKSDVLRKFSDLKRTIDRSGHTAVDIRLSSK